MRRKTIDRKRQTIEIINKYNMYIVQFDENQIRFLSNSIYLCLFMMCFVIWYDKVPF